MFYEILPDTYQTTYLLVTDLGLVWSVMPRFETALSLSYAEVVAVSGGTVDNEEGLPEKGLTITYQPADFPAELRQSTQSGNLMPPSSSPTIRMRR